MCDHKYRVAYEFDFIHNDHFIYVWVMYICLMAFLFVCGESFGLFVGALADVADEVSFVRV